MPKISNYKSDVESYFITAESNQRALQYSQKFLEEYEQLDILQRWIVDVVAVSPKPVDELAFTGRSMSKYKVGKLSVEAAEFVDAMKKKSTAEVLDWIASLLKKKILVRSSVRCLSVSDRNRATLSRNVFMSGRYKAVRNLVCFFGFSFPFDSIFGEFGACKKEYYPGLIFDALYRGKLSEFKFLLNKYMCLQFPRGYMDKKCDQACIDFFQLLFELPFSRSFWGKLDPSFRSYYFSRIFTMANARSLRISDFALSVFDDCLPVLFKDSNFDDPDNFIRGYVEYLSIQGEGTRLLELKKFFPSESYIFLLLDAIAAFLNHDINQSREGFALARVAYKKQMRKRTRLMFFPLADVLQILTVLATKDSTGYSWIESVFSIHERLYNSIWDALKDDYDRLIKNNAPKQGLAFLNLGDSKRSVWEELLVWLHFYWNRESKQYEGILTYLAEAKKNPPSDWFLREYQGLEAAIKREQQALTEEQAQPLIRKSVLTNLIQFPSRWDSVREAIANLFSKTDVLPAVPQNNDSRVVWRFSYNDNAANCSLEPYLQMYRPASDAWSGGRKIALEKFYSLTEVKNLSSQDLKIHAGMKANYQRTSYYGSSTYYYFSNASLEGLIDHPLVFDMSYPDRKLEFSGVKPSIEIERRKGSSFVVIKPFPVTNADTPKDKSFFQAVKLDNTHFQIVKYESKHLQIASLLTPQGLEIPEGRESEVGEFLSTLLSEFSVRLDSKNASLVGNIASVEEVPSDSRIHMLLSPDDQMGLTVEMSVFPLGEKFDSYTPGYGIDTVLTDLAGKQVCAHRDFSAERQNLKKIFDACPIMEKAVQERNSYTFKNPDQALGFLSQLESVAAEYRTLELQDAEKKTKGRRKKGEPDVGKDASNAAGAGFETAADGSMTETLTSQSPLIIKWPHGNRIHVTSSASLRNLSLNLNSVQNWFEASGELNVDQYHLDFAQLLLALNNSSSRFIKMGERDYLALTDQFRKKLEEFQYFSTSQGKKIRIHPLAAQALDESFTDSAGEMKSLTVCNEWKKARSRFIDASNLVVKAPKAFQGELRDYQLEGFQWLARLAAMGTGCCLADDMGLGKTIQAIVLLLLRAKEGPALVVAPTSVCANWEREINRFAPSLNVKRISSFAETKLDSKDDRKAIIESGKPFDVLVTNYSILTIESETFEKQKFSSIVLDEAQAIKNHLADRTQAVLKLQGDFRLITTGTPIENNLGELWSLFEFINPGFLGTRKQFDQKFGLPIQRDSNEQAKSHLKAIVRPFVLRRLKSEVLQELPQKTEVQLEVELSATESALYETIRKSAVESLKSIPGAQTGKQRIQILAELMRLRRLCCHPSLIAPDSKIPGSKLELIGNTVAELLENNHKVLLFSQFTDYLKLIESSLIDRQIETLYLDGSMTQTKRQRAIDAFQNGDADVFLISLKAGGFGLNLTAADYVIHADPWWNPAVENQASDRAHRIGQKRPVTVYRMITKGTIEEKIMELHQRKDQLAEDIIGGADSPSRISFDELVQLLR